MPFEAGQQLSANDLNNGLILFESSTSNITSPATDQVIYDSSADAFKRYNGSTWVFHYPGATIIQKTSAESVTSSTTLQNDNDFAFSVVTSGAYILDGYCLYTASTTGDLKADFTVPAGASFEWTNFSTTGAAALTDYNVVPQGASVSRDMPGNGANTMTFAPRGWLTTAGTAGTLQFRWAQNTSDGTATIMRAGSWMRLIRIA